MSVNSKMTAVTNEIRNKTGLVDKLGLDQMAIDVAAIPTVPKNVPSYVQTEAERVASAVAALQNEHTISFIAMSDIHASSTHQDSIIHMAQAAAIIKGKILVDFTAVLGDVAQGAASDMLDEHMQNLITSVRVLSVANPDLRLDGNHDNNIYNAEVNLSPAELHRYTSRFNNPNVAMPETDRGYFLYDLTDKKLRVICLNTADLKDISPDAPQDGHHISAEQFAWLVSALDMTGKDNWNIIMLSHHPLHWGGRMPKVLTILDAYIAGTSGSITEGNVKVEFDFSGKNVAKILGTFHGHTHNLIYGKVGDNEIIRFGTPNACYSRNNEYGSDAYDEDFRSLYGETETYAKTADSKTDTAFVVYTIDVASELIYATCYGAGYNRWLSWGDSEPTPTFTNLVPTSTDADGNIYNGTGYKDGYRLNSSGTETASDGACCTGFIAYNNQVIRVYGSTAEATVSGQYIGIYDENYERIDVMPASTYGTFEETGIGRYVFTLSPSANPTRFAKAKYIRCSAASCNGADLIVTLDEEISI